VKRFEFKLQKLLEIREAHEKEVQNELAALMVDQNRERIKQDELKTGIETQRRQYRERMKAGKVSPQEMLLYEKYVDISYRAIDTAQSHINEMEPGIQEVRRKLIEASKERKVVEKLKERRREEYDYEVARELAKEADDMNQKIYLRRQLDTHQGGQQ
jgi:flagellar FliJ protein